MDQKIFGCGRWAPAGVVALFCLSFVGVAGAQKNNNRAECAPTWDVGMSPPCPTAGDAAVVAVLKPIRQKYGLPAIAGAIVSRKGVVALGVVGVRKAGTTVAAAITDQWHLGSDGKAMTATVIAGLVEQGKLKWDTTLADVFPTFAARFHPAFRAVTIRQLLTHQAGLADNLDWRAVAPQGSLREQRLEAVVRGLSHAPAGLIGGKPHYSNLGYVVAGAVVEKITGQSWEQAMRERLFSPLNMRSAGFGGTGTPGAIDQPWPHTAMAQPTPQNGVVVDNAPVMGPAGCIHCSLADWGSFIADQLRGECEASALLKPSSYAILHAPPEGNDYAMGWLAMTGDWAGGKILTHAGCNGMNHANVWVLPRLDCAVLVCINQGDAIAAQASDEACAELIANQLRGEEKNRK